MASILLIEDDDDLRVTIARMLQSHGYTVFEAPDGDKGLRIYKKSAIDLVITDIFMPEKEGLQTIIELKQAHPGLKIIAISGGGRQGRLEYLEHAKHLGAARTIEKPVDYEVLLDAIVKVLENKTA